MALKRITKELNAIRTVNPLENIEVNPVGDDLFHWNAILLGPESTPYEGGSFFVDIEFPIDYPFKPPRLRFTTQIYHCNVGEDGRICDEMLGEWAPSITISQRLTTLYSALLVPNTDHPIRAALAEVFLTIY